MSYQISTPKNKKKARLGLQELEKLFLNNKDSNAFFHETFDLNRIEEDLKNISWSSLSPLSYSFYSLKNLISQTESVVNGGSKFLENYIPPFNSTVYKALKKQGAINIVNANLDEFGLGGTGLNSSYGIVENPINKKFISGGSSSGSAYLVNKDLVNFSIVSDTGDSARIPASFSNVYGFKPSYGRVSRYGFYPFCSQFDTPAIIANSIEDISEVFSAISFFDPHDLNTLIAKDKIKSNFFEKKYISKLKIAVLRETFEDNLDESEKTKEQKKIKRKFKSLLNILKKDENIEIKEVSFNPKLLKLCSLIYKIVAFSESISNYSNLNGFLFPFEKTEKNTYIPKNRKKVKNYKEILFKSRKSLGQEFVFRQLIGMYFLDSENYENIYLKSKRILTLINQNIEKLFENYDLILSPTSHDIPPQVKDYKNKYSSVNVLNILLLANFCGLPAISIPWIFINKIPVGLHLMAKHNNDDFLLEVSSYIESFWKDKKE